jgi:hypothetical protein
MGGRGQNSSGLGPGYVRTVVNICLYKPWGIWLAEQLFASQESLCFVLLASICRLELHNKIFRFMNLHLFTMEEKKPKKNLHAPIF